MPITTLQRQFRELGRIRIGQQVEFVKNGQTRRRPEKLGTFRLTSPVRTLLEHAADVYGGTVQEWPEAPDGDEFQLITTADTLDIIVPPNGAVSQWYEMWSGGGCQRRCDGVRDVLSMGPCKCPADPVDRIDLAAKGEACKPTTRLQVVLPKVPDLGIWLLVTHGYYAAVELPGTAELLEAAAQVGQFVPALLWIDQRTIKRPGQPDRHFAVPAIRIPESMTRLREVAAGNAPLALDAPVAPPMPALSAGRPQMPVAPALPASVAFVHPTATVLPTAVCDAEDTSVFALGNCALPPHETGQHENPEGTWPR